MLKEEQSATSSRDQERIDALMLENDDVQQEADGEYKEELSRFDTTRAKVNNISDIVDDMTDRVQKLLDYNEEVVEMERNRIAKVAGKLSDQVFSAGLGGGEGEEAEAEAEAEGEHEPSVDP